MKRGRPSGALLLGLFLFFRDELELLRAGELLELPFALLGCDFIRKCFIVAKHHWQPGTGIFRTLLRIVRCQTLIKVVRRTRIQGTIRTFQDIRIRSHAQAASLIVTLLITTSSNGLSRPSHLTLPMARTTSMPSMTLPKTAW